MKTTDVLKKLKKDNIRVPKDWAVMQTSSGNFVGFIRSSNWKTTKETREAEKYLAEKQAVRESRLLKIK